MMVAIPAVLASMLVMAGLGLSVVCLITPYWITVLDVSTNSTLRLGLWQMCNGTSCRNLFEAKLFAGDLLEELDIQQKWLRPVEALYCLGIMGSLLGLVMSLMYLCHTIYRLCLPVTMITIVLISSFACMVVSGIVFGMKVGYSPYFATYAQFGWSVYYGLGGAASILLASIMYCEVLAWGDKPKFKDSKTEQAPTA